MLVNNAGVMWCSKSYTKEGFETHIGVNHFGHFYLTNLLLPKLIYSSPSRIIVVTCRDYMKSKKMNFEDLNSAGDYTIENAYNQSKLANVMFGYELSNRLKDSNVTVNCIDPGYAYTELMRHSSIYKSKYSPASLFFKIFMKTPEIAAQSVIYASVSDELNGVTGKYIRYFLSTFISLKSVQI